MKKYRFFKHTADIGLIARGETLADAFTNAALGMFAIIADRRQIRSLEDKTVIINEDDTESLLFAWLNRLLFVLDVDRLLIRKIEILEFDDCHIKARCLGEKIDSCRHSLKSGVKAATFHLLSIDKQKSQVRVIFDI